MKVIYTILRTGKTNTKAVVAIREDLKDAVELVDSISLYWPGRYSIVSSTPPNSAVRELFRSESLARVGAD